MQDLLDRYFFSKNRGKLAKALGKNNVAIIASNKILDNYPYKFIQDKNFFYLTGIEQDGSFLILFVNDDGKYEEILFLQNSYIDPVWNGSQLTTEQVKAISGIEKIQFFDKQSLDLKKIIPQYDTIFTNFNDPLNFFYGKDFIFNNEKDVNLLMRTIRVQKEKCEIECIKRACDITKQSFENLYPLLKENMYEYQIEGILLGNFIQCSSRYPSFTTIVASGKNACTLHYNKNISQCKKNDLVLIDTGTEFCNYCSDVTRVFSIDKKFSIRQKSIYQSVLNISLFAKSIVKVGMTFEELQKATVEKVKEELSKLGLLNGNSLRGDEYKKFFMHGVSHSLGLDVHDICDRKKPFCPNMVITIEPGIYIQDENIGIRLEDDVVVHENCCEVLTKDIPIELDELDILFYPNV